jgi:hypothetical protein
MGRVAAPLLWLGPAKLARRYWICIPKQWFHHEVSAIAGFLCRLRGKISIANMRPW